MQRMTLARPTGLAWTRSSLVAVDSAWTSKACPEKCEDLPDRFEWISRRMKVGDQCFAQCIRRVPQRLPPGSVRDRVPGISAIPIELTRPADTRKMSATIQCDSPYDFRTLVNIHRGLDSRENHVVRQTKMRDIDVFICFLV